MISQIVENGGCFVQNSTYIPKYKRRKISAVRDFPYGCGPNVPKIYAKSFKGSSAGHDDEKSTNGTKDESKMDIHTVGSHEFLESKDYELPKISNEVSVKSSIGNATPPCVLHFPLQPETLTLNSNNTIKKVEREYPPRRKFSAIRDFPFRCGRDAPRLTKAECVNPRALSHGSLSHLNVENKDVNLNQSVKLSSLETGENSKADGNANCKHEQLPALNLSGKSNGGSQSNDVKETVLHIPSCPCYENTDQTSNEIPLESELPQRDYSSRGAKSESENETVVSYEKFDELDGGYGKEIVLYNAENYSSDQILENGFGGCDVEMLDVDDGVGKEIVVHLEGSGSRGKHMAVTENSAKRVIVHALMAGPNCNEIAVRKENKHLRNEHSHSPENSVDRATVHALITAPRSNGIVYNLDDEYSRGQYIFEQKVDNVVVCALMAAPNCPWRQSKAVNLTCHSSIQKSRGLKHGSGSGMKKSKVKKLFEERRAMVAVSNRKKASANCIEAMPLRSSYPYAIAMEGDELDSWEQDEGGDDFCIGHRIRDIDLPPVVPNNAKVLKDSINLVSYNKVRETLRLFQAVFRKLMHEEEATLRMGAIGCKRVDLVTAKILKDQGKYINAGHIVGSVPGVDIGLEFQFRVELAIVGLHRLYQAGIDYMKQGGTLIATSIVASGGYADDMDSSDVLIYSGSGGNPTKGDKKGEDQKLERGNLALKNSIAAKNPVRVIRGHNHKVSGGKAKTVKTYTYDGLYVVTKYWQEPGSNLNLVYMFRLERIPGQPELAWNVIKKSKKSKVRHGVCIQDISMGKELIPICAVNTIDDQKPPSFKYITRMLYPDWCRPLPLRGCNCVGGCSDSASCSCAVRNGGEIPFNNDGSIVEVKSLVYECGPSCKCPPSCPNRVSQFGIRFQLEIFKTESRGWGVRSLNYISSGSFICEYLGELLEDRQAEQRIGSDEYLFDIGSNFSDQNLLNEFSNIMPHPQIGPSEVVDDVGFTIDAERYGNVGRFINHSCSPNLYAQNVLFDHEDSRMPHIMLFAAENIPPLQELTYHYNYSVGEVRDANGNVKIKHCFCASAECTGRLY